MDENVEISEKELERRRKISIARKKAIKKAFEEKRRKGFRKWLAAKRREIRKRKTKERHEKEKEKRRRERERLKYLKWKKKNHKIGRPKKRGPKKKYYKKKKKVVQRPKVVIPKKIEPQYRLLSYRNGKQNADLGYYNTVTEVYAELGRLMKISESVIFPATIDVHPETMCTAMDEYVILMRGKGDNPSFRNEFGKLVEVQLESDKWHIIDKVRYYKEETFWVFGYHKYSDRKTCTWIYENLLMENIESIYDHKRILTYKNKLIFKDDSNKITLILCKHSSDAIKLYNFLQQQSKKDKIKNLLFIGDFSACGPKKRELEEELMVLTGWPRKRLQMSTTSYFRKK